MSREIMSADVSRGRPTRPAYGIYVFCLLVCAFDVAGLNPNDYTWDYTASTTCPCQVAVVGTLRPGRDWPDDDEWQNAEWWIFTNVKNPGPWDDDDKLGPKTKTYNCHSYCFRHSEGWLNEPSPYYVTGPPVSGCWVTDDSGDMLSETHHSCRVNQNTGKCGQSFLCRHNERVYTANFPTTRFKYVP